MASYHLCSAVPSVFRCLVDTMKGCSVTGVYPHLNETLETVLRNMTAYCPQSCDPAAGHNCSLTYYDRVVMSFVDGIDCPVLGRYVDRRPIVDVTITTTIIIIIIINTNLAELISYQCRLHCELTLFCLFVYVLLTMQGRFKWGSGSAAAPQ